MQFEILTKEGFKPFQGVSNMGIKNCLSIKTSTHHIVCSDNHLLTDGDSWIEVSNLKIDDIIETKTGLESVISIDPVGLKTVYDALEVSDTHSYYVNGFLSHNCEFLGSVGSLINSQAIRNIVTANPIKEHDHMKVYEEVQKDRIYLATVDVARGAGGDYSVVVMTDITTLPYKQVAVYRNNNLNYLLFPGVIFEMCKKYNDAYCLIELNDNGEAVADDLFHSYEYDNILTTGGNKGKVVLGSWINSKNGVRTTKQTKRLGCSLIKALIENQEYQVFDYDTVQEMSNFVAKAGSYEADAGATDDIMMCLVIFAWASNQAFFAELCDSNFKKKYIEDSHEKMMQELSPIGYWDGMDNGDDVWNL